MDPNNFDSRDIENIVLTIRARGGRRFLAPLNFLADYSENEIATPFSAPLPELTRLTLNAEESKHALRSLRLDRNDLVSIFDPELQIEGIGRITDQSKGGGCCIDIFYIRRAASPKNILLVGLAKPQVNEMIVEKATEIGALAVLFYQSDFASIRSLSAEDLQNKVARLVRIRDSALKQSYADWAPEIRLYSNLENSVAEILKYFGESTRLAGDPNAKKISPLDLEQQVRNSRNIIFAIGSEGGFSPKEYELLDSNSFKRVSLGTGVLRVETAAILSLGLLGLGSS